ncbi:MAG: ATP-binding protein [Pseudorhodobacter sp.]
MTAPASGRRWFLAAVLLAALAAALAFTLARNLALSESRTRLDQSLILTARAVEAEIERFRALPGVAAEDARIRSAILAPLSPARIAIANGYLARIAQTTGADQLYLLNADGITIASSNHDQPGSFMGHDYSFRPYFRDAMSDGTGRFYAIGVTTGKPGYFLSSRVDTGDGSGVVVVKIDLAPLQATWASASQPIALADADGVVFLAGDPGWLYRPLGALSDVAVTRIARERTYDGVDPASSAPLMPDGRSIAAPPLLAQLKPLPSEGWQLVAAAPVAPVTATATAAALAAALATLFATGLFKLVQQRRQLTQMRLAQSAQLEARVRERTAELAREVQARRQTEADLRAAQEGLIHSEKMAALGRMSAAIVHEISQPLAAMEATLGAAELTLPKTEERSRARISTVRGLVRRMQRTVKHLKSFSRREQGELALIDLRAVVQNALDLTDPRARAVGVMPETAAMPDPLICRAGAVRMEQVLVNLILNALDAVEGREGGHVRLVADACGPDLQIVVADNGSGIAPEDLARVTEPFFSTKTGAEGLGLGLAISQALVAEFGGRLDIASPPGAGTTVTVTLPAAHVPAREAAE